MEIKSKVKNYSMLLLIQASYLYITLQTFENLKHWEKLDLKSLNFRYLLMFENKQAKILLISCFNNTELNIHILKIL